MGIDFQSFAFLYIVPLKQGLKHRSAGARRAIQTAFLYIVPLKQGLKHMLSDVHPNISQLFLYIVPLKQGLKQGGQLKISCFIRSFYT